MVLPELDILGYWCFFIKFPLNLISFCSFQDWEDGLCECDADGSFLHENWNKDLRLFADGEDGGQQLLQVYIYA